MKTLTFYPLKLGNWPNNQNKLHKIGDAKKPFV